MPGTRLLPCSSRCMCCCCRTYRVYPENGPHCKVGSYNGGPIQRVKHDLKGGGAKQGQAHEYQRQLSPVGMTYFVPSTMA
jgi:hypothetical protein